MEDNPKDRNLHRKSDQNEIQKNNIRNENELRDRSKLMWGIIGAGILLLGLILYFVLQDNSHYERGMQYLKQKQYTEAMVEFQKVDTDDKHFKMAQSKINYINGLKTFNDGLNREAKVYLSRVDPADEYYNESQLMVERINIVTRQSELEALNESLRRNKDTVIIKEKIIDTSVVNQAREQTKYNLEQGSKIYISKLQSMVKKFESVYQLAKSASVNSRDKYILEMDSIYKEFNRLGDSKEKSETDLKQLANSYIQKRIDYINNIKAESSTNETNLSRSLREEGDQIYRNLMDQ